MGNQWLNATKNVYVWVRVCDMVHNREIRPCDIIMIPVFILYTNFVRESVSGYQVISYSPVWRKIIFPCLHSHLENCVQLQMYHNISAHLFSTPRSTLVLTYRLHMSLLVSMTYIFTICFIIPRTPVAIRLNNSKETFFVQTVRTVISPASPLLGIIRHGHGCRGSPRSWRGKWPFDTTQ